MNDSKRALDCLSYSSGRKFDLDESIIVNTIAIAINVSKESGDIASLWSTVRNYLKSIQDSMECISKIQIVVLDILRNKQLPLELKRSLELLTMALCTGMNEI